MIRSEKYKRFFALSILVSAILIAITLVLGLRKIPDLQVWTGKPQFDASHAYNLARQLAQGYPNRVPWRPERQAASDFLKRQFKHLGYDVSTIPFDEVIGGVKVTGLEDIYATLRGKDFPDEYVVVLAHYDITDTTVEGATDDASGVGTVLELARLFKKGPPPRRSLIFLLTDSEEFGAFWGAHSFVKKYQNASKIIAAVSLDFVAPDKQRDIMVLVDGLQTGYAPLWLRELALKSIRIVPFEAVDTQNLLEFVQRSILIPPADHGAFLSAGIPAVNFFGRSEDFTYQMSKIHHTPLDNLDHLRPESFVPYGSGTEILLRSIDAMPQFSIDPNLRTSDYWKLSDNYYLTGFSSHLIHFFLFVPFAMYVGILFYSLWLLKRPRRPQITRILRNEAKNFTLLLVSFLAGYGLLKTLPDLQIITKYEMFPATQKSLILYRPEYVALALVLTFIIVLYFLLSRFFASRDDQAGANPVDIQIRHSLLGIILGIIVLLAFLKNSYLATLLLLPPTYLWMFMKKSRRLDSRLFNSLLFIGGLVSFIAICVVMATIFHVGVFYWYLFLAISYGLISMYAAILALAVVTVGIRILRNIVL